ncbi:DUF1217 domain-containing protein [Paracoccus beibuensis]|uniref:DUF1217 domain-containing protein n=1 Tax=Paracoccus beibuensis TaxID=547602 RepID=UPI00223F2BD8|nr:DUF1217 domain-containing protein [Paracoccus beibuensis]
MSVPFVTGVGGIAGWKIIQRSEALQVQAVAKDPVVQRSTTYFKENISRAVDADELVQDYRLLSTALSAFGLEADIPNKAFIRKVLESDISDDKSLVNRLADKRYRRLAEAFGYGSGKQTADLAATVSTAFVQREFERRVGEGDETMRLALNARRELQELSTRTSTQKTLWYEIMGNPPMRKVFEGAFGFPASYGQLPVERQLQEFMKASENTLGTSSFKDISEPAVLDKLINTYMARSQIAAAPVQNRYTNALTLLSGL